MLKHLYSKPQHKAQLTKIFEQKIITDTYTNKFFIRSSSLDAKDLLILDNNSNFFIINRKSIEKHLTLFKEKTLIGKSLQLKNFLYQRKSYFKLPFFLKNQFSNNIFSYMQILFLLKKSAANHIHYNWTFLIINRGGFFYFFNGLKGFLPKKTFNKFKKIFKAFTSLKYKFKIVLKKHKKLLIKSLLLKNLKANKPFITKNKYKNQLTRNITFPFKAIKVNLKNIK